MKKHFILLSLILFFLSPQERCFAQNTIITSDTSKISTTKLAIIGGTTAAFFTYGYIIQNNIWWKGEKSSFHFNNSQDYKYSLNADKFGHFYFAQLATNIYSDLFQWSGIKKHNSLLYGGLVAFTFHTFTEVRDGFSSGYGFSWGDLTANLLGAAYPSMQNYYPNLKSFNFKISFYPSEKYKNGTHSHIPDDYESTYHWLAIDINKLLPKAAKEIFPDFIDIAIGHSVNNLDGFGGGNHELYLSLDWDFESLPGEGIFWKSIKRILNYYHFPAPAIKVYPNVVWYGIKF
ncbi:MAG: YfiM family protein [Bacteroidetes bacterium]|nr:YfiM family protein [Bacteroidota bacterium]MBU1116857.1 YfiM family protein [Bacteroidota bacterium]MBU1797465.1 YfiM family protein [Bacteroidota bacterium]